MEMEVIQTLVLSRSDVLVVEMKSYLWKCRKDVFLLLYDRILLSELILLEIEKSGMLASFPGLEKGKQRMSFVGNPIILGKVYILLKNTLIHVK